MILLSRAVRVYVATTPVYMRRSFDGLMAQVRSVLVLEPRAGGSSSRHDHTAAF
jgi:hypothetical protein